MSADRPPCFSCFHFRVESRVRPSFIVLFDLLDYVSVFSRIKLLFSLISEIITP